MLAFARNLDRHALDDLETVGGEPHALVRVVRQETNLPHAQIGQDLRPDSEVPLVGLESEALVGLDRVETAILQVVGANLVREPDPAPLLPHVEEDPLAGGGDHLQGQAPLLAAIAAERPQDVPGQALRVDTHEDRLVRADLPAHEGHMLLLVQDALEEDQMERAETGSGRSSR